MSIDALHKNRNKRRRRWPRPRLTDARRAMLLLSLAFTEGWLCCYTVTHSRLPQPLGTGTPQWMITGSLLTAIILPFIFLLIIARYEHDGDR
ncbi:hypothetical protein [Bifidobacterium miconisargentati]|uniref:hypothetical protein n=1 Tax=Bifidobacterium miconisargentati TaxID=2834437 RepID=UPI001BDD4C04|nr:hypothetical protein [Bifidobacterium miconisargentati]MBW3090404.1 hypothetical protein [Bifidobacterium miconisargentati]